MTQGTRPRVTCWQCGRRVPAKKATDQHGRPLPIRHYQPGYAFDDDGVPHRYRCPAGEHRR